MPRPPKPIRSVLHFQEYNLNHQHFLQFSFLLLKILGMCTTLYQLLEKIETPIEALGSSCPIPSDILPSDIPCISFLSFPMAAISKIDDMHEHDIVVNVWLLDQQSNDDITPDMTMLKKIQQWYVARLNDIEVYGVHDIQVDIVNTWLRLRFRTTEEDFNIQEDDDEDTVQESLQELYEMVADPDDDGNYPLTFNRKTYLVMAELAWSEVAW